MAKNVTVKDVFGNVYEATYPRRAKGLVRNGRARFVDDNTICLVCPPDEFYSEDFFMNHDMSKDELLREAEELNRQAEELLAQAKGLNEEANDAAAEAGDLREEAGDLRGDAESAGEKDDGDADEAEDLEAEAAEREAEAEARRAEAEKVRQQAQYLKEQAKRMCDAVGAACEQAGERVKAFVSDHQPEIDAAKDTAIKAALAAKDAMKKAFDTTKKYAGEAWDYAGRHMSEFEKAAAEATAEAAGKTKEAARDLCDKAQDKFREARRPRTPFEEPIVACSTPAPELTMEYLLGALGRISEDSRFLRDTLEELRQSDPVSSNAAAQMIAAREQTNRELIKTYTRMYDDLRAYPYWSASQRLQELKLIQQQFAGQAPEGFLENLTAQVLSEIYLGKQ